MQNGSAATVPNRSSRLPGRSGIVQTALAQLCDRDVGMFPAWIVGFLLWVLLLAAIFGIVGDYVGAVAIDQEGPVWAQLEELAARQAKVGGELAESIGQESRRTKS